MPDSFTLRHALPVLAAFAVLLTAGVAAMLHLAARRQPAMGKWTLGIQQLALQTPWNWQDVGKLLLLFAFGQLAHYGLPPTAVWSMVAFQGVLLLGILWLARRKPNPFGTPLPWPGVVTQATLRWLAILPLLWFSAFVWQLLLTAIGHPPDLQLSLRLFLGITGLVPKIAFLIFAIFIAPPVEEVLFRGILLPLLARTIGPRLALILTSIAFAGIHADIGSLPSLALFAVALSLAFARTRSLFVPIAMHMLFNGVNLLLLFVLMRTG